VNTTEAPPDPPPLVVEASRPKLLDLYACQGGAGTGYHRAGFDVYALDIDPQPRNPFPFHQGDAITALAALVRGEAVPFMHPAGHVEHIRLCDLAAAHSSPPCQALTTMSNRHRGQGGRADEHVNLIPQTRAALLATGLPYVIENVPGAASHLRYPITLHGGMFGLGVDRPRLFETNWPLMAAPAPRAVDPVGVYGKAPDGRRLFTRSDGTEQRAASSVAQAPRRWAGWTGWTGGASPSRSRRPTRSSSGEQMVDLLERAA
jgi:DNA (cytosine-5)-methyltransferase 1